MAMKKIVGGLFGKRRSGAPAALVLKRRDIASTQNTANNEVNNHPADMSKKLGNGHRLAGIVGLLSDGMLAVRFQGRSSRRPNKVRPPNPGIPEFTELFTYVPAHFFQ